MSNLALRSATRASLAEHEYRVPDETLPTIAYYVEQQSVFVVLRLSPGEGTEAMQPVRVGYPGYMSTFPLKMVTVGASGVLDLSLWVIAEQRYEAHNYGTVRVASQDLVWDFATSTSNYDELFAQEIDAAGGAAWVAEYASLLSWLYLSSADEVAVASTGLSYPYVSRLRTSMLVDHISDDLELAPASDATDISTFMQAEVQVNRVCPDWDGDGSPDVIADESPALSQLFGCQAVHHLAGSAPSAGWVFLALALATFWYRSLARTATRAKRRR